jgi:hypothetical protein
MGSMGCTMLRKGSKVGDFMDQRKQKLVGIEVYVERDGLNGLISAKPKISEFGISRFFNKKMEGAFFPKLNAIGNCAFGEMPMEETKELWRRHFRA